MPDLTAGGQTDGKHDWNLGPTGARGWMWGWKRSTLDARQILVTEVAPESPATGKLLEGDVIVGLGSTPFDSEPRRALGDAIVAAERDEAEGLLTLLVWRDGETNPVELQLPVLGEYGDRAPWSCEKSNAILDQACEHIAAHMKGDIDGMVNALALLATGREEYSDAIQKLAREVGSPETELTLEGRTSGLFSWQWGYRNVFLCEYFLATRDRAVMPAILEYSETIAEGQSGVGTWGHGMAWPDLNGGQLHGSLGGYGALNQAGLVCHLSLVLAQKCGVQVDEVDAAVERANAFAAFYAGKGAIPYGDHRPGWHSHDDNGKNSLAALIFDLQGHEEEARFFAKMTVSSYGERERGHTGNYFSYLWGALGAGRAGPKAAAAFLREQRWFYDLARAPGGGFPYQGGAGMEGGEHKYGDWDCTGAFVLAHTLPLGKLYITGRDRDTSEDLNAREVQDAIECGRGFDMWTLGAVHYDQLSTPELLERLESWSPAVRYRAATALSGKDDAPTAALIKRLRSTKMNVRYGACQALGMLGERGAVAVPALQAALDEGDVWLRIQAAYALAGIGDAARAAVPDLLRLAVQDDPNDPREFTQRYLAFCLFYRGGALGKRGLLSKSLDGVDRGLLLPAVERLLLNDDGRARAAVATVYKNLPFEELTPILPAIVEAIRTPSPSGVMFSNGIRLSGVDLLAKHRIKEGMSLGLQLTEIHKWGKQDRVRRALKALTPYGGAARAVLPELRELRDGLSSHSEAKNLSDLIKLCDETIEGLESSKEAEDVKSLEDFVVSPKADAPKPDDKSAATSVLPPLPELMDRVREAGGLLIASHRGGPAPGYPENAVETLQYGLEHGIRVFEVDVAESQDGTLYLMHDRSLRRTGGHDGGVADTDWSVVARLDLRDADGSPTGFSPPTLVDVLRWARRSGAILELDRKSTTSFRNIIKAVRAEGAENHVLMISYSDDEAIEIARLAPELMMTAGVEGPAHQRELEAAGVNLTHVIAWLGTRDPNFETMATLGALGIESAFGTLGRPGQRLDDLYIADGDAAEYQALVDGGLVLLATDRPYFVARELTADDVALQSMAQPAR